MKRVLRSRSRDLLRRLLQGPELGSADICRELRLDAADFDQLVAGTAIMSIPQQLCFAALLLDRVPRLARDGRLLRSQALAASAFGEGATTSHASRPMNWSNLKARRG